MCNCIYLLTSYNVSVNYILGNGTVPTIRRPGVAMQSGVGSVGPHSLSKSPASPHRSWAGYEKDIRAAAAASATRSHRRGAARPTSERKLLRPLSGGEQVNTLTLRRRISRPQ